MTPAELRKVLGAEPFRPFTLRFGSGKTVEITRPDLVAVSSTGRTAIACEPGADAFNVIDIASVKAMGFSGIGSGRRRRARKRST